MLRTLIFFHYLKSGHKNTYVYTVNTYRYLLYNNNDDKYVNTKCIISYFFMKK